MTSRKSLQVRLAGILAGLLLAGAATTANAVPIMFEGDLTDGAVHNGAVVQTSGIGAPDVWDFWTFSANAGDNITVTALRLEAGLDTGFSIWFGTEDDTTDYTSISGNGASSTFIAFADDDLPNPGPFGDPQHAFVAANTGIYTVAVVSVLSDTCGTDQLCDYTIQVIGSTATIPEPGTLALFGLGLAGLGFARRKRAA